MQKEERDTLLVIARLTPDSLFTMNPDDQCQPFACTRPKGHVGIHILYDPRHPVTEDKLMKMVRGEDV